MTDDNLVGQTLAGKYRVEQVLGKGGMGLVLGARHIRLDEPVAIKILRASMMEVDGMVTRFLREARAASKIKSVHVVRVTDVDTLEDGVPYMVMEHLTGIDFCDLRKQQGKLDITEAVGYVLEACEAIAEAHSLGIVHRDLKPSNLFLHKRKDGRAVVKVLDFGISKLDGPGEQDTTKTGQMMGSPKYMSPEQMLSMHHVDGRSDIWSLGAILYEFFAGRPPFLAENTPRICAMVLNADPARPTTLRPELPLELEQIVLRCLEKNPEKRFATVADLVEALEPFGPAVVSDNPRSTGTRRASVFPELPAQPVLAASTAGVLPLVTPTLWDAVTKIEGPPPKAKSRRRVAAALAGVALLGGLAVFYATQSGDAPTGGPAPSVSADTGPTAAPSVLAAAVTVTVNPTKPAALNPADLPDAAPAPNPAGKPRPFGSASGGPFAGPFGVPAASFTKKPKRPPASDPFRGSRN